MRKFTRIPKMVTFQRAGAPAHLIPTYCALADYASNEDGVCWPRMDTVARKPSESPCGRYSGISRP